tara:strand:- start:393 stop:677 length:285 start_codon:yes stop_codon:yes gene_type:complete
MAKDFFLGDPALDKMMKVLVALSRETYVLKDRVKLMESLLDKKGMVTKEEFNSYVLSDEDLRLAKLKSDEFVGSVFAPLLSRGSSNILSEEPKE